jgi:hypothetical protein
MHLLWRFEICLPSLYNLIEFSPNNQNTPKLFVPIKRTNIYISSDKFVLNRSISMEVRFNTFPLSWWCDNFPFQLLRKNFPNARYRARYLHLHFHSEHAGFTARMCNIPGVTYKYGLSPKLTASSVMCVINLADVQTDRESDVITSVSLRACARSQDWPSTDRPDVIKEKSHGCESTKPHLCFVVAPVNLCLTCTPYLTWVKYKTLLQANNQHFSPVLSTKLSYQLVSRHTEFTGQTRDRVVFWNTPWTTPFCILCAKLLSLTLIWYYSYTF